MKRIYITFLIAVLQIAISEAQPLSGTKTIDINSGDFTTFDDAISALNTNGPGTGGVIFLVTDGQVFNSGPLTITATGSASAPIIFRQSGTGTRPVINFTGTSSSGQACFKLTSSDYITFEGLELLDTGNQMEYGFYLSGTGTDGCRNNTIKNCLIDLDMASSSHYGIYLVSTASSEPGTNSNNTFINNTIRDCYTGYYFLGASAIYPDSGNVIDADTPGESIIENISSEGIRISNQSNMTINNTTLRDFDSSNSLCGIYIYSGTYNYVSVTNNSFIHFSTSSSITGIYFNSGDSIKVSGNIMTQFTSSGGNVNAIRIATGKMNYVFNNIITDMQYTGSGTRSAVGILYSAGSGSIYNNMISGISAPASGNTTSGACGIQLTGGQTVNLFHNTVLLNYTSTNTANTSSALSIEVNSPANVVFGNNIFVNNTDVSTGTRAMAFRKGSSGGTSYILNLAADSDNNLYYAGEPGEKNLVFYDGVKIFQTLSEYQAFVVSKNIDVNAITEDVPFVSSALPYDLHINPSVMTYVESGGKDISNLLSITTDIDGDMRNMSSPDIGADEGVFTQNDIYPPNIIYTPLVNTVSGENREFSGISITDHSGVNVLSGTKPRVYFKKITDFNEYNDNTSSTNGWKWVEASGSESPFSFMMDFSMLHGGSGLSAGDIVQYFVIAQDNNSTPKIGINSGAFNTPPQSVNLSSAAFPVSGDINSFSISFAGEYLVGAGQKYSTLTCSGGLFQAISSGSLGGDVQIRIISDLIEDGSYGLTQWSESGEGFSKLTIVPNSQELRSISGNVEAGLIRIANCSNVYFDGDVSGTGRYLNVRNTNVNGAVFSIADNSGKITLQNLIIESASYNIDNGAISFGIGSNPENSILNCEIRDLSNSASTPRYGIYIGGAGNRDFQILNNDIHDFGTAGIVLNGGCRNILVEDNRIFGTRTFDMGTVYGIQLRNSSLTKIFRNTIFSLDGTSAVHGIYYEGTNGVISSRIENNMIYLSPVSATTLSGITYSGYSQNSVSIYHNSVYLGGILASGPYDSYALGKLGDVETMNVKNNIFVNGRTNSGGTGIHYAVNFATINGADYYDYNDYYSVAENGFLGKWVGSTVTSLAAWMTNSVNTMDAASIAQDPDFLSESDLHLNTAETPFFLRGTPLNIANDIDGDSRNMEYPYIGCDEDPGKPLPVESSGFMVLCFELEQNFPNPFNPETIIRYTLPEAGYTELAVYSLSGQKVAGLVSGYKSAGSHSIEWNGSGMASGLYIYQVRFKDQVKSRKMLLIK